MVIRASTGQWKVGVASLVPRCSAVAKARMRENAEQALEESQAAVHVVTGRLKASGRLEERDTVDGMEIDVVYGGGEVDYAGYEEAYHPFLEPACAAVFATYESSAPELEGPFD